MIQFAEQDFDIIIMHFPWKDLVKTLILVSILLLTLAACSNALGQSPVARPTLEEQVAPMPEPSETTSQQWRGIPIMPGAMSGEELSNGNAYRFTVDVAAQAVQDFYSERLTELGWSQPFDSSFDQGGGTMNFRKEGSSLTVTVTTSQDSVDVLLVLALA